MEIKKEVKREAFKFSGEDIKLGDNGDNAKTAPVQLIALSGKPFDTPFWGHCIQDLSGYTAKKRIAIDLEHDEPIGYINRFEVIENRLVLNGAITPVTESAKDTLALLQAGVPFESSIDFSPSHIEDLVIEEYIEGQVLVNGMLHEAPLTVFRKWPLRAVAICKSGADNFTETTLQKKQESETVNIVVNQIQQTIPTQQADKIDMIMTIENKTTELTQEATQEAVIDASTMTHEAITEEKPTIEQAEQAEGVQVKAEDKVAEDKAEPKTEPITEVKAEILAVAVAEPEPEQVAVVEPVVEPEPEPEQVQVQEKILEFTVEATKQTAFVVEGLQAENKEHEKRYAFLQSQSLAKDETILRQAEEIAKLKEGLNRQSIRPVSPVEFEQANNPTDNIRQQLSQTKDPIKRSQLASRLLATYKVG